MTARDRSAGLLGAARHHVVKAGGKTRLPRFAAKVVSLELGGVAVVFDVVPSIGSKRVIDLKTDGNLATTSTIVFSYVAGVPGESSASPSPIVPLRGLPREHAGVIEFGNGQAVHRIEVDVTEGTAVAVPSQSLDVQIVQYTTSPESAPESLELESSASVGYGETHALAAVKTQRALVPLGGFELFDGIVDAGPLPRLEQARTEDQALAVLASVLSRALVADRASAAFDAALDRIFAVLPPREPLL